jgi:hypothetical protein
MSDKKVFIVGQYKIELIVPNSSKEINNINAYDENELLLWNISELLKSYSDKMGLKYYEDMYFEIRILDHHNIFCVGFINHCEIDLDTKCIIRIVNNR